MKIAYCIAGTYRPGGMERVLANKTNYLSNCGHDLFIITTDQRGRRPFFELDPRIQCFDLNINYESNNGASFWKKLIQYPLKQIRHWARLKRLLADINADIVISMFCNEVSFITKIKDGSKKVLEIHFSKFKRLQYGRRGLWRLADLWRTKMDEHLVKKFDGFVVLTHEDKSYWGNLANIKVIPNSIPNIPEEVSALFHKNVIAIGRYTYQKGFDDLISIWAKVCQHLSGWQLNIVGDGELKGRMLTQIQDLQVADSVSLVPPTSNIENLYLNSSILVLTSRYEGLPMVLLEAQSYGLPIVAYKCKCGPLDVLSDNEDGFIVPEGDKDEFAKKLIYLMTNQDLRISMGQKAREASFKYSEQAIMQEWISLFNKLQKTE